MQLEVRATADGTPTLFRPDLNEHYHSRHGALRESLHVFVQEGLRSHPADNLHLVEVGFGTGLNALLALDEAKHHGRTISYTGYERYPIGQDMAATLNLPAALHRPDWNEPYRQLHAAASGAPIQLHPHFTATVVAEDIATAHLQPADLIFFDAFAPEKEPDLWTSEIFRKLYASLRPGGILVTYSAKGRVRRTLLEVGFEVEKRPGPPGKRQMLKAHKP